MRLSNSDHPHDATHAPPALAAWLIDHVIDLKGEVAAIKAYLHEGDRRMDRIEHHAQQGSTKKAEPKTASAEMIAFMREVASPREWVAWAVLMVAWLKGAILAPEVQALLLNALAKATGG